MKTRVGVMRGGVGSEYKVSLKTGSSVLKNIPRDKYSVFDVLITKDGKWHLDGLPVSPAKLSDRVDVVFNALHGEYGEDGKVQHIFEQFGVPYTGSSVFASAVAMNKALSKYYFKQNGIKTPNCLIIKGDDDIENSVRRVFRKLTGPYVVKPISSGSSVGISIVKDFDNLVKAVRNALRYNYKMVLVEEYISGREITCGVIDSVNDEEVYVTDPVEIITPEESDLIGKYKVDDQNFIDGKAGRLTNGNFAIAESGLYGLTEVNGVDFTTKTPKEFPTAERLPLNREHTRWRVYLMGGRVYSRSADNFVFWNGNIRTCCRKEKYTKT